MDIDRGSQMVQGLSPVPEDLNAQFGKRRLHTAYFNRRYAL